MAQGAATSDDVISASWSLMLDSTAGLGPGSGIGNIVQQLADINQCISIILSTHPGEDPLRPTFGCDMHTYMDKPLPIARAMITGYVSNAITAWEPRVTVLSVTSLYPDIGSLSVTVTWQLNLGALGPHPQLFGGTGIQRTTVVFI